MKTIDAAISAIGFATGSAHAADFSFTGNFAKDNEVQSFNLAVAEPAADVTVRTWSFAGGTNAAGTEIAGNGFDPIVALFNASTDTLIDQNDDSGSFDSFLMLNLDAGNYTATLTQFGSFGNGPLLTDGFRGSSHTDFGGRDSHWALDVLNVNSAVPVALDVPIIIQHTPPIPEPESFALLLAGLGLVGFMARRAVVSNKTPALSPQ